MSSKLVLFVRGQIIYTTKSLAYILGMRSYAQQCRPAGRYEPLKFFWQCVYQFARQSEIKIANQNFQKSKFAKSKIAKTEKSQLKNLKGFKAQKNVPNPAAAIESGEASAHSGVEIAARPPIQNPHGSVYLSRSCRPPQ